MSECKCDMRTRLVGDGCEHCNPAMAIDYLKEQVREQADEIARLRLTDAEREAVEWILANARLAAGVDRAATLRGLLERTK